MDVLRDLLASHKRMRASLLAALSLDPPGIGARITEMDQEIAQLTARLMAEERDATAKPAPSRLEMVSIRAVRAA